MRKWVNIFFIIFGIATMLSGCGKDDRNVNNSEKEENEEVMTLYTLYETDEWNQLIAFYKEKHPEVTIRIETGVEADATVTESEAIQKLNTELLNGQGPDVICFDGFGAENYEGI